MTAQHFLVPIDFSSYAEQALDSAIALAQKLQARVTLLHVIQPPGVNVAGGIWPSATFLQDLEAAVTRDMEGHLARVTAAGLEGEWQAELILHVALDPAVASRARKGELVKCFDYFGILQTARN